MEYSLLFYAVVLLPLAQSLTDTGLIEFINSNQSSWIAGMNFHNQTKEEILPLFHGVLGLHPDPNFTVPMVTHNIDQTTIPVNFDARNTWPYCANIIGNIRNQGTCGSCWAFSVAEVMSDRLCIQSGGKVNVQLAPEDILTCCHTCGNYCFGGYTGSAFQYVQMYGVIQYCIFGCKPYGASEYYYNTASPCQQTCSNTLYQTPYSSDKHFGTNYYQINPSELQIQAEIFAKGSVEADFTVYQDFWYYQSGVYYHTSGQYTGQHAIKIIGWGTENGSPYWLVANSWGKNWGSLGGFFKILRGRNECGIEQRVLAGNSRMSFPGGYILLLALASKFDVPLLDSVVGGDAGGRNQNPDLWRIITKNPLSLLIGSESAKSDPSSGINPKGKGQATIANPKQPAGKKTSGSKKRVRSSTTTPPAAEKQKRMRRQETTSREHSYREVAASHLRVPVIDVQHPLGKLTADQVEIVQNGLMGALNRQFDQCLVSGKQAAIFRGIKYTGEILRKTCEDEVSLKWLQQTVRSLTHLWEGAQLNVVPLAELPRLVRATLWIPGPPVDAEVVFRRLEGQNQWAHIKKWLLFHHEAKPEAASPGNLLVFGLGMDEAKIIRGREGRINYMLSSFNLKLKENEASAQEGRTPKEDVETPGDEASTSGGGPARDICLVSSRQVWDFLVAELALQQINFIQINLQHCRMATTVLCRRLDKMQNTIAIIQKPWIVKSRIAGLSNLNGTVVSGTTIESPRTCIYIPRKIKAVLLPQVSSRDVTAVDIGRGEEQLVIASVYLLQGAQEPCPTWEMANLVIHCDTGNINLIIDWEVYKEHRKEFKKELRKRKRETWRSFSSGITSTASAARLKRVLSKDHTHQQGFLKKEDGTFTATLEESAELLLQTMFPGSTRTTSHSKRDVAGTQPSPKDWALAAKELFLLLLLLANLVLSPGRVL
ncbi:hypothetical protein Zmor_021598 [Zophobas morio]|uniref:Peptidase C1A papain C-terminal domain-containing protein n=1 Tax=Zophobas morio TaxID=2755281 RepID=A0AA38MBB9_9CUCU|nr:hypothetical protein Zmor_021598 [Zophobas morio]